jgi:hypothetical protein
LKTPILSVLDLATFYVTIDYLYRTGTNAAFNMRSQAIVITLMAARIQTYPTSNRLHDILSSFVNPPPPQSPTSNKPPTATPPTKSYNWTGILNQLSKDGGALLQIPKGISENYPAILESLGSTSSEQVSNGVSQLVSGIPGLLFGGMMALGDMGPYKFCQQILFGKYCDAIPGIKDHW